ncbi:folate-binding protein [Williamsia sp.]|uniref:CAF17-like 4Fe-4S cluster assembly/insertion protein YgfZ n=1 Tax=Williamsia sp. TaxID=1872085 RepID=UPI001A2E0CD8|nr:folate-binding protein [Williamsia sp.]MBJ7289253.1 folate-binding protein YgfZ [Williamsia sp.]
MTDSLGGPTANPSPLLVAQQGAGAVGSPDESPDAGVAWHFGDPLAEQRSAERSAVVIDRSHRGIIEISGDERLSWLHTISSQFVSNLADRASAENLSLDLNGRVEDHFVVTDIDELTFLDTERERLDPLLGFLQKMVFWAKAEPVLRDDMAILTLLGPDAITGPIADLLEIPADAAIYQAGRFPEQRHDDEPSGFWRIMPPFGDPDSIGVRTMPRVDVMVPATQLTEWWQRLTDAGAKPAGMWTYEALRVAAGFPRLGLDTDDRTIPHEVEWIGGPDEFGAVHLEKGCYRGQETVARVHNLGKPPRRLVLLQLDGSADSRPSTGDPVTAEGRAIGRVGTVIDHYEYGPIALALIKRSVPVDTPLVAGGADATIDPTSLRADDRIQAGRAAIEGLRSR